MRRWLIGFTVIALFLLAGRGTALAREIRQGDQCEIGVDEIIEGNLLVLCRALEIKGQVNGDLIGAATDAVITGTINGDIYLVAGQLDVAGVVEGSLHFGGPVLRILSSARLVGANADLMSLSLSATLQEGVEVPGNITAAGYQLILEGDTGGEVSFWGSALRLNNTVGGDVDALVGDPQSSGISQLQTLIVPFGWDIELENPGLVMGRRSAIEGDLRYSGAAEGAIGGTVAGEMVFTPVISQPDLTQIINNEDQDGLRLIVAQALRELVVLALIGVAGLIFVPRQFQMPLRTLQSRALPSMAVGLLAFIVSFPVTIVLLVLIVLVVIVPLVLLQLDGLFVALISGALLGTLGGAASLFYFTAIFISRAVVCLMLGRLIVQTVLGDDGTPRISYMSIAVGVVLLSLLVSLPVVGIITSAIAAFWGLGAILILLQTQLRSYRDRVAAPLPRVIPPRVARRPDARALPPPILDDGTYPPGTQNLPEGFEWWDN